MKFSVSDFLLDAFSTKYNILETVDSLNIFVTLTVKTPVKFIEPLNTSFPAILSSGIDSPVRSINC